MEPSAIERDLEELETRMERLRALYEQYFIGIEKLEPQIPRKEVERRIHLLRKEQIRNTALRFKFQMLIQRYNTLQQYWARVAREMESGTYRRDVMRAAARFGAKEAVTILGKRRAEKYAALAEAQAQRKAKPSLLDREDEEVELDSEDLIDDEGEASDLDAATAYDPDSFLPLVTPDPMQRGPALRSGVAPLPEPPVPPAPQAARQSVPPLPPVMPLVPPPPAPPATPGLGGLRWGASPRRPSTLPQPPDALPDNAAQPMQSSTSTAAPSASASPDPKSAIRPAESAVDDASPKTGVKRRVAELAAAMRTYPGQGAAAAASPAAGASLHALDLDLEETHDVEQAVGASPQRSLPAEVRAPSKPSGIEARASMSSPAIEGVPRLGGPSAPAAPLLTATPPARSPLPPARERAPVREKAAAPRPLSAAPEASASADGSLSEQRIRQIYAKYVETKRKENESTAGVTYDKLAATLRAQSQRLLQSHPTKTVDYEVVVKDGKTQLKPILK